MATNNITNKIRNSSIIVKLIVINVVVFILFRIFAMAPGNGFSLESHLLLPFEFFDFIEQPWSILTYSFLHSGIWHVGMNMFVLYMIGAYVLNLFTERRFLTIYLLGAMAGGGLFLIANDWLPAASPQLPLGGASGAVMAVLLFIATYAPYTEIRLIRWNIKLWHIAVFFVVFDVFRLVTGQNPGGMLAHLGGALFGFVYAKQLAKGNDIGSWFEKLMEGVAGLFKSKKSKPFKKVHRNKTTQFESRRSNGKTTKSEHQQKVDGILDKIGKSGYDSLTKAEKDYLFKAGKDD
ncbi:MAG: rhomboid family intramembrane serine protease [Bacteroidota bacterium]